ncbi:hypothetical protein QCA50_020045 [Cerrena zonata]|uniref:Uncharacterized protein n=1 Tax=Cerrena zonata TaxID=2478898 RepID=A0AAW0FA70_9APHY
MATSRHGTRAQNANKHPGQIVIDSTQKRRPQAEVDAEKADLTFKKKQQILTKAAKIDRLTVVQQQEVKAAKKAAQDEVLASHQKPVEAVTMKLPLGPLKSTETAQPKKRATQKVRRTDIEDRLARDVVALDADSASSDIEFVEMAAAAVGKKRALPASVVLSEVRSKKAKANSQHGFREGWESSRSTSRTIKLEPGVEAQDPAAPTYGGFDEDDDNDDTAEGNAAPRNGVPAGQVVKSAKPLAVVKYKSAPSNTATTTRAPRRPNGCQSTPFSPLSPYNTVPIGGNMPVTCGPVRAARPCTYSRMTRENMPD